jgi:phosphate transport system substrate-binding protein
MGSRRGSRLRQLAALAAVLAVALSCGAGPATDSLAGRYTVKGGGAPFEVTQALTAAFAKAHPKVTWDFEDLGSKGGMAAVDSGEADLGTASIDLLPEYKGKLEQLLIGVSGTGILVAAANPVQGLTRNQVRDIFSGAIIDWSQLGGSPGKISLVVRSPDTAIWTSFTSSFFDANTKVRAGATVAGDLKETVNAVRGLNTAIGIVTTNSTTRNDVTVRLLPIDGIAPTQQNLRDGTYKARRPLYLLYRTAGLKPAVAAFLEFARSPEGQQVSAQYQ